MRDLQGIHITVIGGARSGVAAALLLHQHEAEVFVTDAGNISEAAKATLSQAGILYEEGGHTNRAELAEFAVISPGVPTHAPIVQHFLTCGKKVYSEIEVASWFTNNPVLAITGSNGKTTVTSWLAHIWQTAGASASVAGNIGHAFSERVATTKGIHILEVSSFQLDHIDTFKPHISVLLNITPDHMDRYGNKLEAYAASKFRITENQTAEDYFIFNYDDPLIKQYVERLASSPQHPKLWAFSNQTEVPEGAFVRDNNIIIRLNRREETLMPVYDLGLSGQHNLQNGLAAALAARAGEIRNEAIRESLRNFTGVEHRLELVRMVDGVKYINDSKATNVNSVWFALDSFNVPITLIMGGRDKGNDYSDLHSLIREKVHTIIAIGESKDKIEAQLESVVPNFIKASTMHDAVRAAKKVAKRGEIVLLSPACSSFDMFEDYEHRGKVYKEEVAKL